MSIPVIVFSMDTVRGRIITMALRMNGFKPLLLGTYYEIIKEVGRQRPRILVFDTVKCSVKELELLRELYTDLPDPTLIILADQSYYNTLIDYGVSKFSIITDHYDPVKIVLRAREINAVKAKRKVLLRKIRLFFKSQTLWTVRRTLYLISAAIILMAGLTGGYLYWCLSDIPDVSRLEAYAPFETSILYSSDNEMLAELYLEKRTFVPHEEIPEHIKNAFIAIEDKRFYEHHGVDFIRVIAAAIKNLESKSFVQGASTITQQLVKMLFLTPEKSITRKIKELILSLELERKYSKEEILGLYLNQAYFGTRAYGIEAASQTYFEKTTENINVAEAALLAGLPKAPNKYSPFKNKSETVGRRNLVLKLMHDNGFITKEEYNRAIVHPIPTTLHGRKHKAPYFVEFIRQQLEKKYGDLIYASGLSIYTTLDYRMQQIAENAVGNGIKNLEMSCIYDVQAALLAVDIKSGHIKAMVGGTDFWQTQYNRVTQAKRQPGSAFKPFVYLTALNQGLSPDHILQDRAITYKGTGKNDFWTPANYNRRYNGEVTLKDALTRSLNAATVFLANDLGIKNVINTARKLGIQSKIHPYLSTALGASEVTLEEIVYAYAAFSNGYRIKPIYLERIIDRKNLSHSISVQTPVKVINEEEVKAIRELLRSVIVNGTGKKAMVLDKTVYGKTGTTNDSIDAWFVGFDDNIAVGVWVGRDNNKSIGKHETGSSAALPIWIDFMENM